MNHLDNHLAFRQVTQHCNRLSCLRGNQQGNQQGNLANSRLDLQLLAHRVSHLGSLPLVLLVCQLLNQLENHLFNHLPNRADFPPPNRQPSHSTVQVVLHLGVHLQIQQISRVVLHQFVLRGNRQQNLQSYQA
jgi:hypothetical protein